MGGFRSAPQEAITSTSSLRRRGAVEEAWLNLRIVTLLAGLYNRTMSEPPYHGLYINLDRSTARRDGMEKQLDRLGLSPFYARFPAIDGASLNSPRSRSAGRERLFPVALSSALERTATRPVRPHSRGRRGLSSSMRPVIEQAIAQNVFEQFDVLFTDTFVPPHLGMLKFEVVLRRPSDFAAAQARRSQSGRLGEPEFLLHDVVHCLGQSIDRFSRCISRRSHSGRGRRWTFSCARPERRQLRADCLFPFITSFNLDEVAKSTLT